MLEYANHKNLLTVLCLAGIVLQVLDYVSTRLAIERAGAVEANPLIAWLIARVGMRPAVLAFKTIGTALFVFLWWEAPPYGTWVAGILVVIYLWVTIRNFKIAGSM